MIGSGIFVLPGLAIVKTGPSLWLAYIFAGFCVLPAAFSKSELATAMPTSGGTYVYLERTFGPLAGSVAGLGLWLSLLLKSAFSLVGFSAYLTVMRDDLPQIPTALILLVAITVLNIVGVKAVSKVQKGVVVVAVACLAALSLWSLPSVDTGRLTPFFSEGGGGFLAATAFVYLSFAGVTKLAAIAEEIVEPEKNIPIAMILSLGITMVIYGSVTFVLCTVLPYEDIAGNLKPLYTLTERVAGRNAALVFAVLGIVTMTSMAISGLLAASRFPFAMSRDHLLPDTFHGLHATLHTPIPAILLTGVTMGIMIIFVPVAQIAKLTSAFKILIFMAVNVTVIVLRETATHWYRPSYLSPLYPWMQIGGILLGFFLLVELGIAALAASLGVAVVGLVLYLVWGRRKVDRKGVVGKIGRRRNLEAMQSHRAQNLDDVLPGEASIVIPLFGHERSAEVLVEVGAALAPGARIEVLHLTEVPEQTDIMAMAEDDPLTEAVSRRLEAMAEEEDIDLVFNTAVSRDLKHTVDAVASRVHCDWVVLESNESGGLGITVFSPIGWLQDHLTCNLAVFKDAGVRYIRQILVWPEPGPHDALVVSTADHLARVYNAELNFVAVVPEEINTDGLRATTEYLAEMTSLCEAESRVSVIHDRDPAQALIRLSAAYDLLIMGAPPERSISALFLGTAKDRVTRAAACSVLWLKTPRASMHLAVENYSGSFDDDGAPIVELFAPDCVKAKVDVPSKDRLFVEIARVFGAQLPEVSPATILDAMRKREQLQNTGVAPGVALPHVSLPRARRTLLGVFTLARPMVYGAADDEPVELIFVSISSPNDRKSHLALLSTMSRLLISGALKEQLLAAETDVELLKALRQALGRTESRVIPRPRSTRLARSGLRTASSRVRRPDPGSDSDSGESRGAEAKDLPAEDTGADAAPERPETGDPESGEAESGSGNEPSAQPTNDRAPDEDSESSRPDSG